MLSNEVSRPLQALFTPTGRVSAPCGSPPGSATSARPSEPRAFMVRPPAPRSQPVRSSRRSTRRCRLREGRGSPANTASSRASRRRAPSTRAAEEIERLRILARRPSVGARSTTAYFPRRQPDRTHVSFSARRAVPRRSRSPGSPTAASDATQVLESREPRARDRSIRRRRRWSAGFTQPVHGARSRYGEARCRRRGADGDGGPASSRCSRADSVVDGSISARAFV